MRPSKYDDVRHLIQDADGLLFRHPKKLVSKAISVVGRSTYSHAAKAVWHGDILLCAEVREFKGGRLVTLRSQVEKYPGMIDVYKVNKVAFPDYDRWKAGEHMVRLAGQPYAYLDILRIALLHLPLVRWFAEPKTDDSFTPVGGKICSMAVAEADRVGGGVDPVPHLADCETEPADISRSMLYQYSYTLLP